MLPSLRMSLRHLWAFAVLFAPCALAQLSPYEVQTNTWNSSLALTPKQVEDAQLTDEIARSVEIVTNSDRSQLANGGPRQDDFYSLPSLENTTGPLQPGTLLKVQAVTDPTNYAIPPNTALSRFMYTTKTLNGTIVPATSFVLWPFEPRRFGSSGSSNGTAPVVLWCHGTSGFSADAAPSAMRNLWYGYEAPYPLALDGYAVIGPDYAGLGVDKSWDGSHIAHQWDVAQVGARDALYALQAAWKAFPNKLTKEFVSMGHSQGGGVAWGIGERLALNRDEFPEVVFGGYKGTIAGSPVVNVFNALPPFISNFVGIAMRSIFPDFSLDIWLTDLGLARNKLWTDIRGAVGAAQKLFLTANVTKMDYTEQSWHAAAFEKLANPGGKDFKGPVLVLQGTDDVYCPFESAKIVVEETCVAFPDKDLEFLVVNGTGHVPTLDATRHRWLKWIADRFEDKPVSRSGCYTSTLSPWLPLEQYRPVGNHVLQWVDDESYSYQAILGL